MSALALLRQSVPGARLLVVGDGDALPALRTQAAAAGLAESIVFAGKVPPSEVARYYALMDALCLPRKPFKVCQLVSPIKPAEAMLLRVPLVVSDVAALKEMVREGETALVHPAGDARALADCLLRLERDRPLGRRLAAAAATEVLASRTWQHVTARMHEALDALQPRAPANAAVAVPAADDAGPLPVQTRGEKLGDEEKALLAERLAAALAAGGRERLRRFLTLQGHGHSARFRAFCELKGAQACLQAGDTEGAFALADSALALDASAGSLRAAARIRYNGADLRGAVALAERLEALAPGSDERLLAELRGRLRLAEWAALPPRPRALPARRGRVLNIGVQPAVCLRRLRHAVARTGARDPAGGLGRAPLHPPRLSLRHPARAEGPAAARHRHHRRHRVPPPVRGGPRRPERSRVPARCDRAVRGADPRRTAGAGARGVQLRDGPAGADRRAPPRRALRVRGPRLLGGDPRVPRRPLRAHAQVPVHAVVRGPRGPACRPGRHHHGGDARDARGRRRTAAAHGRRLQRRGPPAVRARRARRRAGAAAAAAARRAGDRVCRLLRRLRRAGRLVAACGLLADRGIDFRLLLVGDGAASDGLRARWPLRPGRRAASSPAACRTARSRRTTPLVDIAPFPRKPWEVCELVSPLKPFEAMAAEKAVVVSGTRALREVVRHERNGLVFEKGSVEALAQALERLVADADLRAELGRRRAPGCRNTAAGTRRAAPACRLTKHCARMRRCRSTNDEESRWRTKRFLKPREARPPRPCAC
ncbi:glycosyltransferase [Ramlibacter terrae]|uniref:Glycosyltransferase n=1 Tax=Ramlibacter terrae TaxID=2732511 RepID=A0ABX6P3I7_9BURK|nr:glycosyltransferase [Ramlibacter terrae]